MSFPPDPTLIARLSHGELSFAVVQDGKVLAVKTLKNGAFLPGRPVWEKAQDVQAITAAAEQAVAELCAAAN